MSKRKAATSNIKLKITSENDEKRNIGDAIVKILLMLMGISGTVFSFTECFEIKCSKGIIVLSTIGILLILAFILECKRQNLLLGILALCVVTGIILLRDYLKTGILSLANAVLFQYQNYYDDYQVYTFQIDTEGLRWSSMYWYNTIVICGIIIEYAYIVINITWNKIYTGIHYVFVGIFLALPMAFGIFPPTYVIVLLMIYCMLCLTFRHERRILMRRASYVTGLAVLSAIVLFCVENPNTYVEKSRFRELKDAVNRLTEKLDFDEMFAEGIFSGRSRKSTATGGLGRGLLGEADKIKFTGETMLEITTSLPRESLYLKGYGASYYQSDQWSYNHYWRQYEDFLSNYYFYQNDIMGKGFDSTKDAAENIMNLPYYATGSITDDLCSISIKNLSGDNNYYVPYNAFLGNRKFSQDLMVSGYNLSYNVDVLLYDYYDYTLDDFRDQFSGINLYEYTDWYGDTYTMSDYEQYRAYVEETCLNVPDYLRQLFSILLPDAPHYHREQVDSLMECVDYVEKYLKENTKYSLSPGRLEDEDFVVDFLMNKKKGYCTSYATTAALMLRYMGVPTRYAEGYRVDQSEIMRGQYDTNKGEYTVYVKDSSAHAWTEVYVDGIGFMVVDLTPAGSYNTEGNAEVTSEGESASESDRVTTTPTESGEIEKTTAGRETDTTKEGESGSDGQGSNTGTTTLDSDNNSSGEKSMSGIILAVLIITSGIVAVSVCIYVNLNKKKSGKWKMRESLRKLSLERQRMILMTEELFEDLKEYGFVYGWDKYTKEYAEELENLMQKAEEQKAEQQKAQRQKTEQQRKESQEQQEMEIISAEEFLMLYQQAKFSNENDKISGEDYKKVINYVDKCKNSLQYLKK